jgi:hypothetical protein
LEDEGVPSKEQEDRRSKKRSHDEAGYAGQSSSSPPSSPCPNLAKEWKKAKLRTEDLPALVNNRFLGE